MIKAEDDITQQNLFTYRRIRRAIGWLAFSLPVSLVLFSSIGFFKTGIQQSISEYYYTNLREIFTGTLCAVGFFLIRYKGNGNTDFFKNDTLLTSIAGAMAIGVALLPTNPDCPWEKVDTLIPLNAPVIGWLHYGCAAMLFMICSVLCINVFTLGPGEQKEQTGESRIYRICGWSIIVFIIMVPLCAYLEVPYATLIFEAFSLFAFGLAWLVKGRALSDMLSLQKMYGESSGMTEKELETGNTKTSDVDF
ncbi:MAG: hypothetical protein V4642_16325 [Bacteroidota bacterium]